MANPVRTIAIVGGGFCGTVLAADLLKAPGIVPTRIVLIERRCEVGRGVAYEKGSFPFVLNVPASRMSIDPRNPLEFAQFAARRHPELAGQAFLPREVYGEYLQDVLARAEAGSSERVELRQVHGQAEHVLPLERSGKLVIGVSDRERVIADELVLACGEPPPELPEPLRGLEGHPAVIRDPYALRVPFESMREVLLVGTGLTMCDIAVAAASFNPQIRIHALSRHGLVPAIQSVAPARISDRDIRESLANAPPGAFAIFTEFRHALRRTLSRGGDWRDAIGMARSAAPHIWHEMPPAERSRFLRHVRTYWDVHRHRVPAATAHFLNVLREAGQFEVHAGRIIGAEANVPGDAARVRVRFRARGQEGFRELHVDSVINCTGAHGRIGATRDPFLKSLMRSGLAVADPAGLGLNIASDCALIGSSGQVTRNLHYIGPMLRAVHWEATAAGELRGYVAALAEKLRSSQIAPLSKPSSQRFVGI